MPPPSLRFDPNQNRKRTVVLKARLTTQDEALSDLPDGLREENYAMSYEMRKGAWRKTEPLWIPFEYLIKLALGSRERCNEMERASGEWRDEAEIGGKSCTKGGIFSYESRHPICIVVCSVLVTYEPKCQSPFLYVPLNCTQRLIIRNCFVGGKDVFRVSQNLCIRKIIELSINLCKENLR